jgi:hypothetical protein
MNRSTPISSSTWDQTRQWDEVIASRWPLVLERSTWGIIIALITLLYQAVAVRIFRPYTMSIFWLYPERIKTWDADQFRVSMANARGPTSVLVCKPAYQTLLTIRNTSRRREGILAFCWLFGALILTALPFLIPAFYTSLIPVLQGTPASTADCSVIPFFEDATESMKYDKLLALDMLRTTDLREYNYNGTNAKSVGLKHPKDRISITSNCHIWASVCDGTNPMTIDIEFWVKRSELHIGNIDKSEDPEFGVLSTCYLPERRLKSLKTYEEDNRTQWGFLYGSAIDTNFTHVTHSFTPEERFGYGYTLLAVTSIRGESGIWQPNNTLDHDGDRTLLFYHIGTARNKGPSTDPLFRTQSSPLYDDVFLPMKAVIPVMCNTTYSFCINQQCTPLNGSNAVRSLTLDYEKQGQDSIMAFLFLVWSNIIFPTFYFFSGSTESVLAGRTLMDENIQLAPQHINGRSELVRLALAGRTMLLLSATRAASDWRRYTSAATSNPDEMPDAILEQCRRTLIEDNTKITTSGRAIFVIAILGVTILLLTFTGPLLRMLPWKVICIFTLRWRLRTAPHLHRTTVEKGEESRFWPGSVDQEWPDGSGLVEEIGLVHTETGFHAVYRSDATLVCPAQWEYEMVPRDMGRL